MKSRWLVLLVLVAMLVGMFGVPTPVSASAYTTKFITSITYQNISNTNTPIDFIFYASDGTQIPLSRPDLAPFAASALYVGEVGGLGASFKGAGVLISEQPVAATLVQVPQSSSVKNRPMSVGFNAGANYVLVPTVLKGTFGYNSIFTVQNVSDTPVDITVTFVPVSGSPVVYSIDGLPAGAAKYFDMGTDVIPGIGDTFNGAVTLDSTGPIVATSIELQTTGALNYAFEGVNQGSTTVYVPSALCKYNNADASYAIQNSGTVELTNVHIELKSSVSSYTKTYDLGSLAVGAKVGFNNCGSAEDPVPNGFVGSAVITATSASGTPEIVVVGKVFGGGLSTAFVGFDQGYQTLALPYVRWTTDHWSDGTRQRTFIAIQNIGPDITGDIVVNFVGRDGTIVCHKTLTYTASNPLVSGGKAAVNPSDGGALCAEFGYYIDGFGGGAVIHGPAGSQLVAIARVQTKFGTGSVGEDYGAVFVP